MSKRVKLYEIHLTGGGGDHACSGCLAEAKQDHAGSVVSVALIDDPSAYCMWCGVDQRGPEIETPAFSMSPTIGPRVYGPQPATAIEADAT